MLQPVTEGHTLPLEHRLLTAGVPLDIQGLVVALVLEDRAGVAVDTAGKVTNLDDGTEEMRGKVRFSPDDGDLLADGAPYHLQWRVTDGSGRVAFWPAAAELLHVNPVGR